VRIKQVVTHGIALGIYFLDPEDNVNEVYWMTDPRSKPGCCPRRRRATADRAGHHLPAGRTVMRRAQRSRLS